MGMEDEYIGTEAPLTYFEPEIYDAPAWTTGSSKSGWAGSLWDSLSGAGKAALGAAEKIVPEYLRARAAGEKFDPLSLMGQWFPRVPEAGYDRQDYPGMFTPYPRATSGATPSVSVVSPTAGGGILGMPTVLLLAVAALFLMKRGKR